MHRVLNKIGNRKAERRLAAEHRLQIIKARCADNQPLRFSEWAFIFKSLIFANHFIVS